MKLRVQNDRTDTRRVLKPTESPAGMQPGPGSGEDPGSAGTPVSAAAPGTDSSEVRVSMAPSRRSRVGIHSHAHQPAPRSSGSEPELDPADPDLDPGEPSASLSELRCLFRWIQKSVPFLAILCAKLVTQHALGLVVGVGLFTTFLHVNKDLQTQVFLQDRHSKLQCVWLLLFLVASILLLYYTFFSETLHHCLIFLGPSIDPLGFWDILWAVGITSFVIKFLSMGVKCLVVLLPSAVVSSRTQGRWLMLTEELGQLHQATAPVPLWFRYLVTYQEADGTPGLTLGVLLALLYIILKLLGLYSRWTSLLKTVRVSLGGEHPGAAATRGQCSEAGDVCPICQGEYRDPRVLFCQHIFCDECIALWFNREKSCPLCRTVLTEKVYKWRDGATSPHLHVY